MTSEADAPGYVLDDTIDSAPGALPRPLDSSYRGADYDFIRAATQIGPDGESIAYTLDTKRARTEMRAQPLQEALVQSLIGQAADDRSQDFQIRRTLFRLLVPTDLEPFLTGNTEAQFEVDSGTAGIPWELLDDADSEQLRRGAVGHPHEAAAEAAHRRNSAPRSPTRMPTRTCWSSASPNAIRSIYPPLVGAQQEALAVRDALVASGGLRDEQVVALTSRGDGEPSGPNAPHRGQRAHAARLAHHPHRRARRAAGADRPGAGEARAIRRSRSATPAAWCCRTRCTSGPREINSMRTIPELVFVNCCHLAARDLRQLLTKEQQDCEPRYRNDRPKFASGVAEALIKVGVRCVIAAGWAVDDAAGDGVRAHLLRAAPERTPLHRCGGVGPGGGVAARRQHLGRVSVLRRSRLDLPSRRQ